jgi:hypothetical protein
MIHQAKFWLGFEQALAKAIEILPLSQGTRRKNSGAIIKEDMQRLSVFFFALACMRRIP